MSSLALMCSIPSRSNMVSVRAARASSSRGATPSGSSHASARVTSLRTSSSDRPGARSTSSVSASCTRASPTLTRTRSRSAMIAAAAGALTAPRVSASCTAGYFDGSASPSRFARGAVASPTRTSRAASPVLPPLVAAMRRAVERNPCSFARLPAPSSTRDSCAIPAAILAWRASRRRRKTPTASFAAISWRRLSARADAASAHTASRSSIASWSGARCSDMPPAYLKFRIFVREYRYISSPSPRPDQPGNENPTAAPCTLQSSNVLRGRCESEPAVTVRERLISGADPVEFRDRR